MRLLDLSEYWLVAGGDGVDEMPTVVITGPSTPPPPPPIYYPPPPPIYYPPPPPPPPYSGGGSSSPPPPPPPCVHTSPPPSVAPQGVNLNDLRNAETAVARNIMTRDTSIEFGALIYADAAGHLRTGAIATGTAFSVNVPLDVHAGERVVSFIHSHPGGIGDPRLPSTPDGMTGGTLSDTQVVVNNRSNPAFDPNYLTGIVDSTSGRLYEYAADMGLYPSLGKNITNDTGGCK